jgi:hypothetical protein
VRDDKVGFWSDVRGFDMGVLKQPSLLEPLVLQVGTFYMILEMRDLMHI